MALSNATMNTMATAAQGKMTHAKLHTGDPGANGTTNLTSGARQPVTWTAPTVGDFSLAAAVNFTGVAASGAVTHISFWDQLATGGVFAGSFALTGDQTANAAGEYRVPSGTIDLTAS